MMSRALPLLMLTVVVFFTGELWQLAARMTRNACASNWIPRIDRTALRRDHHPRRGARVA